MRSRRIMSCPCFLVYSSLLIISCIGTASSFILALLGRSGTPHNNFISRSSTSSLSLTTLRSSRPLKVSYTGVVPFQNTTSAAGVSSLESMADFPLPPSVSARAATPRPATLPGLSKEDLIVLRAGQRVQHQIRNGCMGSGYVVVDVMAPSKKIWESLLNFDRYAEMVPTIRSVSIKSRVRNFIKGIFVLSKFRFRLSVIHKHRPEESQLDFYLDPDADQYKAILEMAEGFWFIDERPADRPEGWTRVYMTATVKVNHLVPMWLVDYAAERALKRATAWLKPWVEQGR